MHLSIGNRGASPFSPSTPAVSPHTGILLQPALVPSALPRTPRPALLQRIFGAALSAPTRLSGTIMSALLYCAPAWAQEKTFRYSFDNTEIPHFRAGAQLYATDPSLRDTLPGGTSILEKTLRGHPHFHVLLTSCRGFNEEQVATAIDETRTAWMAEGMNGDTDAVVAMISGSPKRCGQKMYDDRRAHMGALAKDVLQMENSALGQYIDSYRVRQQIQYKQFGEALSGLVRELDTAQTDGFTNLSNNLRSLTNNLRTTLQTLRPTLLAEGFDVAALESALAASDTALENNALRDMGNAATRLSQLETAAQAVNIGREHAVQSHTAAIANAAQLLSTIPDTFTPSLRAPVATALAAARSAGESSASATLNEHANAVRSASEAYLQAHSTWNGVRSHFSDITREIPDILQSDAFTRGAEPATNAHLNARWRQISTAFATASTHADVATMREQLNAAQDLSTQLQQIVGDYAAAQKVAKALVQKIATLHVDAAHLIPDQEFAALDHFTTSMRGLPSTTVEAQKLNARVSTEIDRVTTLIDTARAAQMRRRTIWGASITGGVGLFLLGFFRRRHVRGMQRALATDVASMRNGITDYRTTYLALYNRRNETIRDYGTFFGETAALQQRVTRLMEIIDIGAGVLERRLDAVENNIRTLPLLFRGSAIQRAATALHAEFVIPRNATAAAKATESLRMDADAPTTPFSGVDSSEFDELADLMRFAPSKQQTLWNRTKNAPTVAWTPAHYVTAMQSALTATTEMWNQFADALPACQQSIEAFLDQSALHDIQTQLTTLNIHHTVVATHPLSAAQTDATRARAESLRTTDPVGFMNAVQQWQTAATASVAAGNALIHEVHATNALRDHVQKLPSFTQKFSDAVNPLHLATQALQRWDEQLRLLGTESALAKTTLDAATAALHEHQEQFSRALAQHAHVTEVLGKFPDIAERIAQQHGAIATRFAQLTTLVAQFERSEFLPNDLAALDGAVRTAQHEWAEAAGVVTTFNHHAQDGTHYAAVALNDTVTRELGEADTAITAVHTVMSQLRTLRSQARGAEQRATDLIATMQARDGQADHAIAQAQAGAADATLVAADRQQEAVRAALPQWTHHISGIRNAVANQDYHGALQQLETLAHASQTAQATFADIEQTLRTHDALISTVRTARAQLSAQRSQAAQTITNLGENLSAQEYLRSGDQLQQALRTAATPNYTEEHAAIQAVTSAWNRGVKQAQAKADAIQAERRAEQQRQARIRAEREAAAAAAAAAVAAALRSRHHHSSGGNSGGFGGFSSSFNSWGSSSSGSSSSSGGGGSWGGSASGGSSSGGSGSNDW